MTRDEIILALGNGAYIRRKFATVKGELELFFPDQTIIALDWGVYYKFRFYGYCECIATPSKYASHKDIMFKGIPGHDEYYYFGLNEKGKELFYLLKKGKTQCLIILFILHQRK